MFTIHHGSIDGDAVYGETFSWRQPGGSIWAMRNATGALLVCLLFSPIAAQQTVSPIANGVIYGTVTDSDGDIAKEINVVASPLGVALAMALPHTRTDRNGRYRFERIQWGRYTVYAEDPQAGYSLFSSGTGYIHPPEIRISSQHPEAELSVRLPPKAGFLSIHLTNQMTGSVIPSLIIEVMRQEEPSKMIFSESCGSADAILIPPDKDVLLHVSAPGLVSGAGVLV